MRIKQIQLPLSHSEFDALREYLLKQCESKLLADVLARMDNINLRLTAARKLLRFSEDHTT